MGLFSPEVSTKRLVPLCRRMATAYDAGVPILNTLDVVARTERDPKLRRIVAGMADDIRGGMTLESAARKHSGRFPPYMIELLASGEVAGNLDVMMNDLAGYFESRLEMERQITRLLVGPAIRLAAAWFLGTFALRLLPQMRELIAGRGEARFDFFAYLREYWTFQLESMVLFGTAFLLCVGLARLGVFGWFSGLFTTHVWPFSRVTRKFGLARFFRTLSLLLASGIRIDNAVEKAATAAGNPYIQRDLLKVAPRLREGRTLVDAFGDSRYLTPLSREMLEVGEQSGKIPESLHKVAEYHLQEASHAVQVATKFVTVVIILCVAFLIGYIVITFFGTLYTNMLDGFMD